MIKREEYIAELIFLHLQKTANKEQEQELALWRNIKPENEKLVQRMESESHWETSISRFVKTEEEAEKEWLALQRQIEADRKLKRRIWFSYAAVIVLLLSVGGLCLYHFTGDRQQQPELSLAKNAFPSPGAHGILILPDGREMDLRDVASRNTLTEKDPLLTVEEKTLSYNSIASEDTAEVHHTLMVPRRGEYRLVLCDSTVVCLNADSRLTYPVNFKGKERRVYLSGEAYFQVKRNENKPFVVVSEQVEIKVLGTTFGVRAYTGENNILTTLESGNVMVEAGGRCVELVPDKQALFDKSTSTLEVREVNIDLFLSWKDGRLKYDNCPLEKMMTDLSRWYGFDVFFSRSELGSYRFSIDMRKYDSFEEVLQLIAQTGEVNFDIKDNTVIVR